jgi:hypothetical protein
LIRGGHRFSDGNQWQTFDAARKAMLPNFANAHAAPRYRGA